MRLQRGTASPSVEARRAVTRAAVVVNHRFAVEEAMSVLDRSAADAGVELVDEDADADLVLALGGDGTMLGALRARLGTETPVFGFNFGRMGFLTSAEGSELENVIRRVFAGEFRVVELATLEARLNTGEVEKGVNDVVVTSARVGRMAELRWEIEGEHLGDLQCDGMISATPAGSTAYNLSNGGPVMMWGIDAMAITFVAPHSLEARPVIVPRGYELRVENMTRGGDVSVIVDGRGCGRLEPGDSITVGLGEDRSRLAHLPEVSFFTRYHDVFG
jgi:NAD+ kinase